MRQLRRSLHFKRLAAVALAPLFLVTLAPHASVNAQVKERGVRASAANDAAAPRSAESRRAAQTGEPASAATVGAAASPATRAANRTATAVGTQTPSKYKWTLAPRPAAPRGPAPNAVATAGQLIISEFRWNGTNGANDEFVEIYNASGADHTVQAGDASAGYGVASSDGVVRFIIPNGTVIPNRGHYLGCNSVGYSVTSYPAGAGTTATCDATYTADIPINAGIALFNTANPLSFSLGTRIDAVGATAGGVWTC